MEQQDRKLFEELGYINIDKRRMHMFDYIISLTEEQIEKQGRKKVVELVENPQSFIYVEAKMYYECGLNYIPRELEIIHQKMRDMKNCNIETYQSVFGSNMNPTVNESILAIASYRSQQKHAENHSEDFVQPSLQPKKIIKKRRVTNSRVMPAV